MAKKACEVCGELFETRSGKVCPSCMEQYCPVCGKPVKMTPYARSMLRNDGFVCCCSAHTREVKGRKSPQSYELTCRICGNSFSSRSAGALYCDDCKVQKCAICGCDVDMSGNAQKMSLFVKKGHTTCGSVECANELRRITCQEAEGVDSPSQFESSRAKLRERYLSLSEEEKAESVARMVSASRSDKANEKRRRTMVEKYGVECGLQMETCKERSSSKEARNKARATMTSKYGVGSNMERDDVKAVMHSKEATEKAKATMLERYGVDHVSKLEWFQELANGDAAKERRKATCRERFGRDYYLANDTEERIRDYVSGNPDASITEVAEALGVSYCAVMLQNEQKGLGIKVRRSYLESLVADFLDSIGVDYVRHDRKLIAPLEVDFYMPDKGVAIEVNDFLTHSSNYSPFGSPKPKDYHWAKTKACAEKGVRLIHAWEHCLPGTRIASGRLGSWDVLRNVIEHALGITNERVYARNTKVVELPSVWLKAFFDANNINGYRNASTAYCLVPKGVENPTSDDALMAYAVGHAHFGKGKYDAEIARGACRLGVTVVGGASKLWRHIIGNTDYDSIVYYVDSNFYDAQSMSFLENVEYVGHNISFWNYWVETNELKNREPARNAEIKAGYADGSIWKIYNAGTDTYVWHRSV